MTLNGRNALLQKSVHAYVRYSEREYVYYLFIGLVVLPVVSKESSGRMREHLCNIY